MPYSFVRTEEGNKTRYTSIILQQDDHAIHAKHTVAAALTTSTMWEIQFFNYGIINIQGIRLNLVFKTIVTCMYVTIDGVWIGELIYWLFMHTTRNYK
jgi:hypothetical protein